MQNSTVCYFDKSTSEIHTLETEVDIPKICWNCSHSGIQSLLSTSVSEIATGIFRGIAVTVCTYCGELSVHYLASVDSCLPFENLPTMMVYESIPCEPTESVLLSPEIQGAFKSFSDIYTQSVKAEKEGLDRLSGMGYRKAIEFLITDFLIQYPANGATEEWLKSPDTSLSNKIDKIENIRIQNLAKAISFLGNDETHVARRHPEHDISSMKAFIKAFLSFIENEMAYQEAEALINKPK